MSGNEGASRQNVLTLKIGCVFACALLGVGLVVQLSGYISASAPVGFVWVTSLSVAVAAVPLIWWVCGSGGSVGEKSHSSGGLVTKVRQLEVGLSKEQAFSGHLAHELRTPLAVLRMGTELVLRRQDESNPSRVQLNTMLKTIDDMTRTVENLLALARADHEAPRISLEAVELREMVNEGWEPLTGKSERRELQFENLIPEGDIPMADRAMLKLVVQNLLSNAASYTEPGGRIVVSSSDEILIKVWDSGPELSEEALSRIFERLWREDTARTDAAEHAGLGLSLTQMLCRQMGMEIRVENCESGGVLFSVWQTKPSLGPAPELHSH